MQNLNKLNNDLSEALLTSGRLMDLLDELGCDVRGAPGGVEFRGRCPVHKGKDSNLAVRTDGEKFPIYWACHSHNCQKAELLKPTLLGLVRGALTGDAARPAKVEKAADFIRKFIDSDADYRSSNSRAPVRRVRKLPSWTREQVRQPLVMPSPYFLSRNFSPAVLDRFDIGESRKLNRVVAPIYDERGQTCIGFISRSTKPSCGACGKCHHATDICGRGEPRWQFPENFPKGDYLYNFAAALSVPVRFVLLVEGVPDVLRAAEAGVVAVSGFGTSLSEPQVVKLSMLNKLVVVGFDNDAAGRDASQSLLPVLHQAGIRAVAKQPPAVFKDVGEMPAQAVAEWLAA